MHLSLYIFLGHNTVERISKGQPTNMVSQDRWSLVTGLHCSEMWALLPGICGPSRQVVSHDSGLSRQVSLYNHRYKGFKEGIQY